MSASPPARRWSQRLSRSRAERWDGCHRVPGCRLQVPERPLCGAASDRYLRSRTTCSARSRRTGNRRIPKRAPDSCSGSRAVWVGYPPLSNAREEAARHNRYLITRADFARAEESAEGPGLESDRCVPLAPGPSQPSFRIRPRMGAAVLLVRHHQRGRRTGARKPLMAAGRRPLPIR